MTLATMSDDRPHSDGGWSGMDGKGQFAFGAKTLRFRV